MPERPLAVVRAVLATARAVRAVLLGTALALAGGIVVAVLLGWRPVVVETGSMAPAVSAGDLVLFDSGPSPAAVGQVVLVRDPVRRDSLLAHRVAAVLPDGSLRTKGDANLLTDSTPVPADDVLGRARIVLPSIGLPRLWWRQQQALPLSLLAVSGMAVGGSRWHDAARAALRHRPRGARPRAARRT